MLLLFRMAVAVIVATAIAVTLGWAEPYPLRLGAIPAAIFAAIAVAGMVMTRTETDSRIRSSANPLREILLGAMTAAAWLAAMGFSYWLFDEVPYFPRAICDSGRQYIEQEMRELEGRGQFGAAAAVGLKELDAVHTPEWTRTLAEWTVQLLCLAADEAEGDVARAFIDQATITADRHQVSNYMPRLAKERLEGRLKANDTQRQLDDVETQLQRAAAENQQVEQASQRLKRELAATTAGRRTALSGAFSHLSRGIDQGIVGNLDAVRTILLDALAMAKKERMPLDEGRAVLARVEARIAALRPADLPAGSMGRVVRRQLTGSPHVHLIDVDLRDAKGSPLTGLADKDFIASQEATTLRLVASPHRQSTRVNLAFGMDVSTSIKGAPQREAQVGVTSVLKNLPPGTYVRLTAFSDRVQLLADWSQDPAAAIAACQQLRADGGTSLFVAADEVVRSLANLPGERIGVLFTDGSNSLPGPSHEAIIAAARQHRVAIHFVALKQSDYDTRAIEQIARETGGKTLLVQRASELANGFRTLAASLAEEGYRLALLDYDAAKPLTLQIGSGHSVRLTITPATHAARIATH